MEVSLPRRKLAVVGGSDGLEGDGRRAAPGSARSSENFELTLQAPATSPASVRVQATAIS